MTSALMCNRLMYSISLACAFFSFARRVHREEFLVVNNITMVEKKSCTDIDLKRQVKEFWFKCTSDSEQKKQ